MKMLARQILNKLAPTGSAHTVGKALGLKPLVVQAELERLKKEGFPV